MRRSILQARSCLTPIQRKYAATSVLRRMVTSTFFQRAQHIAFYIPIKSELDPLPLLQCALRRYKNCYLPVLHPLKHNRLYFIRYCAGDRLLPNRFGILEPHFFVNHIIPAWALDLVIVPLVGFDSQCRRLGMGSGFYDRTFAFKNQTQNKKPLLVGVGYEMQKLEELKNNPWDVAMNYVVTEKKIYSSTLSTRLRRL